MSLERADFPLCSESPKMDLGSGEFGCPHRGLGVAHPSSLPFLLPLSPSLPRQNQTPFLTWPPKQTPLGWGCSPQHGQDTPSLGMRFPGIPNPNLDTRGLQELPLGWAPHGFGVVWRRAALWEGGNLTWEVTPWIWGGLEDEGALEEGVKVLGVGNLTWEVEEEFYHLLPPPNPASTWHWVTCGV